MLYFAYATSLSRRQMAEHCPGAKPRMAAKLPHYKLIFAGWSRKWRGGSATIRQSQGDVLAGALYEITAPDLRQLDKYEDYPATSDHLNVKVVTEEGDFVDALTFIRKGRVEESQPSAEYLAIIRQGYRDWGLASSTGKTSLFHEMDRQSRSRGNAEG